MRLIDIKKQIFQQFFLLILQKNDLDRIKQIESLYFYLPIIIVIEEGKEYEKIKLPRFF